MALSQASNLLEKAMGHGDNATTEQNMSNPGRDREKYGDPSGEKMKALAWMGKKTVELGIPFPPFLYLCSSIWTTFTILSALKCKL